jgi:phytoene/squalene synthetase
MSDAALHSSADHLGEEALRETIRHRVEEAGTSFYWAMRLLPRDRRNGMYAIYAFCREVDDIADGDQPVEQKLSALAAWRGEIENLFDGEARHLVARALLEPTRRFGLRKEDFLAILAGMIFRLPISQAWISTVHASQAQSAISRFTYSAMPATPPIGLRTRLDEHYS